MEKFEITKVDGGFHVEGFPDAVKLIRLDGPKAKRLADLALHRSDLVFAMECLEGINQVPEEPWVLREAIWRSAIIHVMKCYGSNDSRFNLNVDSVLKGDLAGKEVFEFFQDLRNRHLVHDSNSYAQTLPGPSSTKKERSTRLPKYSARAFMLILSIKVPLAICTCLLLVLCTG